MGLKILLNSSRKALCGNSHYLKAPVGAYLTAGSPEHRHTHSEGRSQAGTMARPIGHGSHGHGEMLCRGTQGWQLPRDPGLGQREAPHARLHHGTLLWEGTRLSARARVGDIYRREWKESKSCLTYQICANLVVSCEGYSHLPGFKNIPSTFPLF